MIRIGGLEKSSLIDYPNKVAAVIFTHGCNFRCPYCHNPELVIEPLNPSNEVSHKYLFEFLKSRVNKLDGVVITGGEPLINEDMEEFIKKIKDLGYLVKLDTNGTFPSRLKTLIRKNLLDYIAMDVKYPKSDYIKSSSRKGITEKIMKSIKIIMESGIDYEFRTTYVKKFHSLESAEKIGTMIKGAERYYIQNFRPNKTIDPFLSSNNSFSQNELSQIKKILKNYVKRVYIR
jgi:pyruvate formate lyase activating enzyme